MDLRLLRNVVGLHLCIELKYGIPPRLSRALKALAVFELGYWVRSAHSRADLRIRCACLDAAIESSGPPGLLTIYPLFEVFGPPRF